MHTLSSLARALALATLCALAAGVGAASADAAKTVTTRGGASFEANEFLMFTDRFAPGEITVRPGERVTWRDADRNPEPHTVTVVRRRNLPDRIGEVFECRICAIALGHLTNPENPEESGIRTTRLDAGRPGLDTQGDSLFLAPGGSISGRVTAAAGANLHYLCAVHPWMQGAIHVRAGASRLAGRA